MHFKIRTFTEEHFKKSLMVAIFLGAFAIGVLTFLIQMDESKLPVTQVPLLSFFGGYKDVLIVITGIGATFLVLSIFGIKAVLVDKRGGNELFSVIALFTYETGYCILAILLPLLVYPFSAPAAIFILVIEAGWLVIFVVDKRLKKSN